MTERLYKQVSVRSGVFSMRISTGIDGLDQILHGGFVPARVYLVYGQPGTGKTTLGVHFLAAGAAQQERCLLICFGQTEQHVRADASSLGLAIDDVTILDLMPAPELFSKVETYDIFSPSEVEREPITSEISQTIQQINPQRIFVDSFGQFRQLAGDAFQYHRLVQSFFRFVTERGATLLVASDEREFARDVDGVIQLDFTHG